ncbi:MAG: sodium:proton antiporter [Propionibacteriales bacterium]|nr:sodium:proton antiporter [Propionibacteriales bacterium]
MGSQSGDEEQSQDPSRDETENERLDRNWDELLQELRVTQTGVQILSGFLLTLPFQDRFADLSTLEKAIYLVAVLLATASTGLMIAPVSFHRLLFRQHQKAFLVRAGDRFARLGLLLLALTISVVVFLVFDVVIGLVAGLGASAAVLALFVTCWFVLPHVASRNQSTTAEDPVSR